VLLLVALSVDLLINDSNGICVFARLEYAKGRMLRPNRKQLDKKMLVLYSK